MKKEVDFVRPLLAVPFAFPVLRLISFGFDWLTIISASILLFVYLPIIILFGDKK